MSYGNIVVSSLKYPELKDDVYYFTSYSIPGLNECFNTVLATSKGDRELLSSNARYFVETNFSGEVLKAKIEKLLDDC